MKYLYWMIPGELAGRPGPDRIPWDTESLYQGGIRTVLSVNDGLLVHTEDLARNGIAYARMPLSDNAPPRTGDIEISRRVLPVACRFVEAQIADGKAVLVHCSSGKDRTGLFLSYFLMRRFGLRPPEAIRRVRAVRPVALSAVGWEEFAKVVLGSLES